MAAGQLARPHADKCLPITGRPYIAYTIRRELRGTSAVAGNWTEGQARLGSQSLTVEIANAMKPAAMPASR